MEEKELKTSPKQRIFIALIAIIMLGSIVASYAAIILNGSKSSDSGDNAISEAKKQEYTEEYEELVDYFAEDTIEDFDEFIAYKSEIKAFNEESANESGVQKKDLVIGTGEDLKSDGSNYLAYYVGYCADESIFDSTLDDTEDPASFAKILDPSLGMIEGWTQGIEGMKIGGIRRITVPGPLAYGDAMEICGGKNKPLRFLVMAVERDEDLLELSMELDSAYMRYQYAQMGIDYDKMMTSAASDADSETTIETDAPEGEGSEETE